MQKVITRNEIERVLDSVDLVEAMEGAFRAYSDGAAVVPPVGELLFDEPPGDAHIKYGYIRGDDVFVVKVATGFYENAAKGLPSNSGLMLVFDRFTGFPAAVLLDEGMLTNLRTAAAGALCAKLLAPPRVEAIGILGTGVQARMQAEQLKRVIACGRIVLWGRRPEAAAKCAQDLSHAGFEVEVAASPAKVAEMSNLIVTTTASSEPLLTAADIRPGTHITAMGSDTPDKRELAVDLLARADLLVADSIAQCRERGEIHHALTANAIEVGKLREIGAILSGRSPGRSGSDDITIADLTGVAVQDIAISKAVLAAI